MKMTLQKHYPGKVYTSTYLWCKPQYIAKGKTSVHIHVKQMWIYCNFSDAYEAHSILHKDNYVQNSLVFII